MLHLHRLQPPLINPPDVHSRIQILLPPKLIIHGPLKVHNHDSARSRIVQHVARLRVEMQDALFVYTLKRLVHSVGNHLPVDARSPAPGQRHDALGKPAKHHKVGEFSIGIGRDFPLGLYHAKAHGNTGALDFQQMAVHVDFAAQVVDFSRDHALEQQRVAMRREPHLEQHRIRTAPAEELVVGVIPVRHVVVELRPQAIQQFLQLKVFVAVIPEVGTVLVQAVEALQSPEAVRGAKGPLVDALSGRVDALVGEEPEEAKVVEGGLVGARSEARQQHVREALLDGRLRQNGTPVVGHIRDLVLHLARQGGDLVEDVVGIHVPPPEGLTCLVVPLRGHLPGVTGFEGSQRKGQHLGNRRAMQPRHGIGFHVVTGHADGVFQDAGIVADFDKDVGLAGGDVAKARADDEHVVEETRDDGGDENPGHAAEIPLCWRRNDLVEHVNALLQPAEDLVEAQPVRRSVAGHEHRHGHRTATGSTSGSCCVREHG